MHKLEIKQDIPVKTSWFCCCFKKLPVLSR